MSGYITVNVAHGTIGHSWLNEQFQFEVNKGITLKIASGLKWAPWGYSATSYSAAWIITGSPYKKDVDATAKLVKCLQPTGSKKRGHTKADMSKRLTKRTVRDTSPYRWCSDFCIPKAENAKAGCFAGSVAGGHTMHVPDTSVAGWCAIFAPTIKWHRIALWGGPHWSPCFTKTGCLFKTRLMCYIYQDRVTRLSMYLVNIHS